MEKGNNESELCRWETGLASNPPGGTGLVKQLRTHSLFWKVGGKIHVNSPSSLYSLLTCAFYSHIYCSQNSPTRKLWFKYKYSVTLDIYRNMLVISLLIGTNTHQLFLERQFLFLLNGAVETTPWINELLQWFTNSVLLPELLLIQPDTAGPGSERAFIWVVSQRRDCLSNTSQLALPLSVRPMRNVGD